MARSRAAFFTARVAALVGAAAVVIGIPLLGANASGAEQAPPTTSTTATTDGHIWDD